MTKKLSPAMNNLLGVMGTGVCVNYASGFNAVYRRLDTGEACSATVLALLRRKLVKRVNIDAFGNCDIKLANQPAPIQLTRIGCIGRAGDDGAQCEGCAVQFDSILPPAIVIRDGNRVCSGRRSAGHVPDSAQCDVGKTPSLGGADTPYFLGAPSQGGTVAQETGLA